MLYNKLAKTTFIASNHYNALLNIDYQPTFSFPKKQSKSYQIIKRKVPKTDLNIKYAQFKAINEIHNKYLLKLKGNLSPDNFLPRLYKAELTGALIDIKNHKRTGIIVKERVNSIFVIFEDDQIKMFIKKLIDFSISLEDVQYKFYGECLKKNRFLRK